MGKDKIDIIAEYAKRSFGGYGLFFTPTMRGGEINRVIDIADDVCIQVSDYYEYIDILGLTLEEQKEMEKKLKEATLKEEQNG